MTKIVIVDVVQRGQVDMKILHRAVIGNKQLTTIQCW